MMSLSHSAFRARLPGTILFISSLIFLADVLATDGSRSMQLMVVLILQAQSGANILSPLMTRQHGRRENKRFAVGDSTHGALSHSPVH
jgi:hypothetical protein